MKKGELAINWLIVAVIGLIVLGLIAFLFFNKSSDFEERYTDLGEDLGASRDANNCNSLVQRQACYTNVGSCGDVQQKAQRQGLNDRYQPASPPPNGTWGDCSNGICCVKTG